MGLLAFGSSLGQAVSITAMPIVARIFSPEIFGEQSAILSVVSPLVTVTTMAYPIAMVIARTDREALLLSKLAFLGTLVVAPIATAILVTSGERVLKFAGIAEIAPYAILIPFWALLLTLNQSAGYSLARQEAFALSAKASVLSNVVGNLAKILLGLLSPSVFSIVIGNACGLLVTPVLDFFNKSKERRAFLIVDIPELIFVAKKYSDFPFYRAPQNLIAALSQSLPILGLTGAFGPESAGHYAMAAAVVGMPLSTIGNAIQTVAYPKLSGLVQEEKSILRPMIYMTIALMGFGIVLFLPIILFGRELFAKILGQDWTQSGHYAIFLVPLFLMGLANRPAVAIIPIIGIQRGLFFYELIATAAKAAAIMIGVRLALSPVWMIGFYSFVGAVAYLALIIWVAWAVKSKVRR